MEHPIPLCMSAEGRPELRGPEREMSDACLSCLVRQQARIGQVVVRRRLPQRDKHATISIGLDEQMEGVA
jgi:hypothetical protein